MSSTVWMRGERHPFSKVGGLDAKPAGSVAPFMAQLRTVQ